MEFLIYIMIAFSYLTFLVWRHRSQPAEKNVPSPGSTIRSSITMAVIAFILAFVAGFARDAAYAVLSISEDNTYIFNTIWLVAIIASFELWSLVAKMIVKIKNR